MFCFLAFTCIIGFFRCVDKKFSATIQNEKAFENEIQTNTKAHKLYKLIPLPPPLIFVVSFFINVLIA